jgi:FixJ family two-component response regulator
MTARGPTLRERVATLEDELAAARQELASAIRSREIAETAIRAVTEENHATNQELLISREKLQSQNDELTVLNGQLQEALADYRTMADDLESILTTSDVATIYLDRDLSIRLLTPLKSMLAAFPPDAGQPLAEPDHHLANQHLLGDDDLGRLVSALLAARGARPERPVVYLVDDDRGDRETMAELLNQRGLRARTYDSSTALLDDLQPLSEGCIVVDAGIPQMSGFELLDRLNEIGSTLPAIMVARHGDVRMAVRALRNGAVDFLEKPVDVDQLVASIGKALEQTRDSTAHQAVHAAAASRLAELTERQRQVLALVLEGRPNKVIAAQLGLSRRTVEAHRAAIMRKTGSKSISALVRSALSAS